MKKPLLFLLFLFLALAARAQSTLNTSVSATTLCAGMAQSFPVGFSDAVGSYTGSNVFMAELSNAVGSFANPQTIGTLTSTAASGTIQATLPGWVPAGTGYRIRVIATSPALTGNDNGTDLTINPGPQVSVSPQVSSVCGGVPVQLSAMGNGATYSWAPATGLSATSGSLVTAMPTVNTTYTVFTTNSCGTATAFAFVGAAAFGTVFEEGFGQVAFTTGIAMHGMANGFDNDHLTFSGLGTDLRNSLASTGYPSASGEANVFINFNDAANPSRELRIDGINTFGMTNLELSFGIRKTTLTATGSELMVEASVDNGASWTLVGSPTLPTGTGTNAVWYYTSVAGPIPAAQNLSLRFRQTASTVQFRIDDVRLVNGGAPVPTISASGPISGFCPGTPLGLTASGGASYLWSTGATTQTIVINQPGTYTVTVTNITNCTATSDPIVITGIMPMPVASNNGPICEGQTLELSVTGDPAFTYSWVGPNSWTSTLQNPAIPAATAANSGMYTAFVTVPFCQPVAVTTTAQVLGAISQTAIIGNTALCIGQTLQLSVQQPINGSTYVWSRNGVTLPNSNSATLSVPNMSTALAGIYSVLIQNSCGMATADVTVTVSPQPAAPVLSSNSPVCQGATLLLSATSAIPGATYSWSGPGITAGMTNLQNPSKPNAQPSHSGNYMAFINANGCVSPAGIVQVSVQSSPSISISSNQPICPGSTLTLMANAISGATYSWSGPNSFSGSSNIVSITNLQSTHYGTYTVFATITGACTSMATHVVGPIPGPLASSNSPVCPGSAIQLSASTQPGVTYSWVGPNGFTTSLQNPVIPAATAMHTGAYTVYSNNGSCLSTPTIIQVDVNGTLTLTPTSNSPVNQGSTLLLSASGSAGNYSWTGPNGFSAVGFNPYIQNVTPANAGNYTVSVNSPGCSTVLAVLPVVVNPMNVITGTVFNDYNNNGVQDSGEPGLANQLVEIAAGHVVITNSQGHYTAFVADGTYTLSPVNLLPTQTANPGSRSVTVTGSSQLSTGNNFGLHLPPVQNLQISSYSTGVAAPGFTRTHTVYVINQGNIPMSGTVRYKPDPEFIFITGSGTSPGFTMSGDTIIWSFTNLQPGSNLFRYAQLALPQSTPLGTLLNSTAIVTPIAGDIAPANNTFTLNQTVVGSWDPNDKAVSPVGPISPVQVVAAQELHYLIRFQNTGTAPAVNILIADTLSGNLNLSSFQMLSASHTYNLTLNDNGILEWHFPNIMLPDSNSNEPLSHGYIQYSIKPKTTLQLGDVITNTAHIFFDFNEAVSTNTTSTIVALPNGFSEAKEAQLLHVYPNPNNGQATLRFTAANPAETTVSVLNLLGQEVLRTVQKTEGGEVEIPVDLQQQAAGIYLVRVQQGNNVYSAKLIRQ